MTKTDALAKIAELKKFIEDLDAPKINLITSFNLGDIFYSPSLNNKIVILPFGYNTSRFCLGGLLDEPAKPYSCGMGKGLTVKEVLDVLNEKGDRKLVRTLKF
jgi:hypothetical protein